MSLNRRRPMWALSFAAVIAIAVAGCSGASASGTPTAVGVCQNLNDLEASISAFRTLVPVTTDLETLKEARDTIKAQWTALKTSAKDLKAEDVAALEAAAASLVAAVDAIPAGQSPADSVEQLQAAADSVRTAFDQLVTGLDCK